MLPNEMLFYGVGGAAGMGVLGWLIRYLVKTAFSTKSEVSVISMGDTMMERLHKEITRLEEIIKKQEERIRILEEKLEYFRRIEIEDLTDIAEMNAVVESACMTAKGCVSNSKLKMILERIKLRRLK